jgi:hypothetical protein
MDILYTETEVLTVQRTVLKTASDDVIHVLEYINKDGKVIDSIMRTKHGYELDDLELTDQIWEFLDAHYSAAENAENTNLENV